MILKNYAEKFYFKNVLKRRVFSRRPLPLCGRCESSGGQKRKFFNHKIHKKTLDRKRQRSRFFVLLGRTRKIHYALDSKNSHIPRREAEMKSFTKLIGRLSFAGKMPIKPLVFGLYNATTLEERRGSYPKLAALLVLSSCSAEHR
jgi:hypothetical protein